ncbi:DUF1700 domain-containing protein [Virgibacillus pantothenticus]|uniref:HAAS signaling domain-containing protein n=1 Tax=Virgibacillus pantothenticus TaxID=1473 RepID=UPI0009E32A0D|nr:DUF1700 domain-containing protein [Virgibacillus pantothenticus]MBU8567008.1 DUF1700 domain-containing protein [Virgibacillus pantothenticus]MBU8601932.1 DUF1700 domain-containing protein [Virgibacillus pantothenticus]MBU8635035.1 DUF1700 domain-containing protein [Virgibacillus pantothenticus]MBU8642864.1 DUF1700 domain-containing protein [Virgibacillus pantothenticus]MBU8646850.1 DUF1700 domain-containing protein [Virgibacillus pantothenticus]
MTGRRIHLNKHNFLKLLKNKLKYMSEKEKKHIVDEYSMRFVDGGNENKSEEEISRELGKPEKIAKELSTVYAINKVEEKKNIKSMFTALLSMIGLSVANCIITIVSLFILLLCMPFILAYIIGVPIMILSPVILIVIGFVNGFHTIGVDDVFQVVKGFILGSLLAILGYYIGKSVRESVVRLFIKHWKWNISIFKGEKLI